MSADPLIETAAVRAYLAALDARRVVRAPLTMSRTQAMERRTAAEAELAAGVDQPVRRLLLAQELRDLTSMFADTALPVPDINAAQAGFIEHAAAFSSREGIRFEAWRLLGVPAGVLARAGIEPASGGDVARLRATEGGGVAHRAHRRIARPRPVRRWR